MPSRVRQPAAWLPSLPGGCVKGGHGVGCPRPCQPGYEGLTWSIGQTFTGGHTASWPGRTDLLALAVQVSAVGHPVDLGLEPCRHQGHLADPKLRPAEVGASLAEPEGLWPGGQGLPGQPRGTRLRGQPRAPWVVVAEHVQPTRAWEACAGWRPPHTRPHTGPTRCALHNLPCPHAPDRVPQACTRRVRWVDAHRPRSATHTSPSGTLGCPGCTKVRSWVRRGAMTCDRSTPVPAWNRLRRGATGTPPRGPLACNPLADGRDTQDHGITSWRLGVCLPNHPGNDGYIPPALSSTFALLSFT